MREQIKKQNNRPAVTSVSAPRSQSDGMPNSALKAMLGYEDSAPDADILNKIKSRAPGRMQAQIPTAEREADRLSSGVGAGMSSPEAVKAEMGKRLGADFSGVRFHTDAAAEGYADSVGARAYTTGSDIYFGGGGFDPAVAAHELVHTAQQGVTDAAVPTVSAPAGGVQMFWGRKKKAPETKAPSLPNINDVLDEKDKQSMFDSGVRTADAPMRKLNQAYMGGFFQNTAGFLKKMRERGSFDDLKKDKTKKNMVINHGNVNISDTGLDLAGETLDHFTSALDEDEGAREYIKGIAANTGGQEFKSTGQSFSDHIMSILPTRGFGVMRPVTEVMDKNSAAVDKKYGKLNKKTGKYETKPGSKENKAANKERAEVNQEYHKMLGETGDIEKIISKMEQIKQMYAEDPEAHKQFAPLLKKYEAYRNKVLGIALPSARDEVVNESMTDEEKAIARPPQQTQPVTQPTQPTVTSIPGSEKDYTPEELALKKKLAGANARIKYETEQGDTGSFGPLKAYSDAGLLGMPGGNMGNNVKSSESGGGLDEIQIPDVPEKKKKPWWKFW